MTLQTPVAVQAVPGDDPILYTAPLFRGLIDATFIAPGVVGDNDLFVSQRGAGANFSVDVSAGDVVFLGIAQANQGKATATNTGVYNVPVGSSPSGGSTRRDSIVAVWFDKQGDSNSRSGSAAYGWDIVCIPGSPVSSGTALPPTLTNPTVISNVTGPFSGYVELAQIPRSATEVSIANAVIFDVRRFANDGSRAYTPVWTADDAAPVIGAGSIRGKFQLIGKRCHFSVVIAFAADASTSGGAGVWHVSLPIQANYAAEQDGVLAKIWVPSVGNWGGFATISSGGIVATPYFPGSASTTILSPGRSCDATVTVGTGTPQVPGQFTCRPNGNLILDGSYWIA